VQYAHARCASVFRQAQKAFPDMDIEALDLAAHVGLISEEHELRLVAKLAEYPRVIEAAAQAQEPHRLAFYLYDLASSFHGLWSKGSENADLRFVNDKNRQLSFARLGLVHAVASVLKSGLAITGTAAPEEMR
jgi:arginyl-tRNA synthetase